MYCPLGQVCLCNRASVQPGLLAARVTCQRVVLKNCHVLLPLPFMFPPEILRAFVHELRDDPRALKTCNLVSTVMHDAAKRHLFHKIRISAAHSVVEERTEEFLNILPQVGSCIRVVSFRLAVTPGPRLVQLLKSLALLQGIEKIKLTGMQPFLIGGDLLALLRSPNIRHLHFTKLAGLDDFAVRLHPSLQHLRLANVSFEQASPLCGLMPRSVDIDFRERGGFDSIGLRPITSLSIEIRSPLCIDTSRRILKAHAASVKRLSL